MQYILLQAAPAAGQQASGGGGSMLIMMVAMFAILYFLMIRPQQKRQKEVQKMLDALQVNNKVITTSGIYGRIVSIKPDKNIVVIEIDDTNKVRVDFQRSAVAMVITPEKSETTTS
ncbi:MAG TPA: preprotein translocase subunit YajC [Candidatus Cloacimonadota bacterium]|nr:preprotein translocase subunit YajC [Candidatus Cloacimonadota bacterium]